MGMYMFLDLIKWSLGLALLVILIKRYMATRQIGYLLLCIALPLWSLAMWPLTAFLRYQMEPAVYGGMLRFPLSMAQHMGVGNFLTLWGQTSQLIRVGLVLFAFILIRPSEAYRQTADPHGSAQRPLP